MMNANEARKMMERAIENEIAKLKESAMQFCEEVSKEIEARASKKYCNLVITVPNSVNRNYVVGMLKDNGYSVYIEDNRKLDIVW